MSSSFGCVLHVWISLQLILSSLYIDHTISTAQYSFDNCSFESKKKCDLAKCSFSGIANITWNVDQKRARKEEQPTARNFLMVESQDNIHYTTSHKETLKKLNGTLWNSICRNININSDECDSIYVYKIDVAIMDCIFKGLKFYLLAVCHNLEIIQINAKNTFRNKLEDILSGLVMICNYVKHNCRQQFMVFSNLMLLRKNSKQDLHFICNSFNNEKSQLKVKQLRSLKTILKFLSSQFNLNFEIGNSKSAIVDILSHANFFLSLSRRTDSSNSLCNQSITWCENVFQLLKSLENSIENHNYGKRMASSNESVNNLTLNAQPTIETRNSSRDESTDEKYLNATKIEAVDPFFSLSKLLKQSNKQRVKDKIDVLKKLQISNNNTSSIDPRKSPGISVQTEQITDHLRFRNRQLLSVERKRKLTSKALKNKRKKLPFKSKVRKSKRHVRSTHGLLFNGRRKTHSEKSNRIPSNLVQTHHITEDIDLKSLPSSSAKNLVNGLLSDENRESEKSSRRRIEEVFSEIADALRTKKIAEEERRLEDPPEEAAAAFFSSRGRRPSTIAKNNRRSVSRSRRSLDEDSAMASKTIDGKAAKIITTGGDGEEHLRRQQAIWGEPVRKSADSNKIVANSQGKPWPQSDVAIGKRNDRITSGRSIRETPSSPEKLIFKLSIGKELGENIASDALLTSMFKDITKLGRLPKAVTIEIIGPTKAKKAHEKRDIPSSNNYEQNLAADDKSFYDEGMKLEQELKELPKLHFKSRLNKLRNRQEFGKLGRNLRDAESNTGADGDVSKLVDSVKPIRNAASEFESQKNIKYSSASSDKNKLRDKMEDLQNFSKNRKKEKLHDDNRKMWESDELSDKESSVYYYDYYDYENSGNNFNRHKSNDLRTRQVGRKLLSLNSVEPDEDISTAGKKSNSNTNAKFYGYQQNKKVESRQHYSALEPSSSLFAESSEITEESSAKLIQCTFNKSIGQFLADKNVREKDTSQDLYEKNNFEIGFLKRNLKSISPARKSSLSEDDPLRQVFVSGDFEGYNAESNQEEGANTRRKRKESGENEDSIKDLYKLFGRDYELNVKGKLHLHFPTKSDLEDTVDDSRRKKRCSGRRRPKGRKRRIRRKRKFARPKYFSNSNGNLIEDAGESNKEEPLETGVQHPKSPLQKITNFFKEKFGNKSRSKFKAKFIKISPVNLDYQVEEDSDKGESTTPITWQKDKCPKCTCENCQTTPAEPEVMYTSVAVDTITTEGDSGLTTLEDLTPQPPNDNKDSTDNSAPNVKIHRHGYHCQCHTVTNSDSNNFPNEYQTTIRTDDKYPESNTANNDLSYTRNQPDAEIEVSQLPDLQTQTYAAYTTPIIIKDNPISRGTTIAGLNNDGNLGNDVIVNGEDQKMNDLLDILHFIEKVDRLMENHKTPFRVGDKRGGVEIKLQKIYIPSKQQSIQLQKDGSARRTSNDLPVKSIDTPSIHQTVTDSADSFSPKAKSEENFITESPIYEIEENQISGNSKKNFNAPIRQPEKHKEYEKVDEFETYIEGPPKNLLSNEKPERNEKSSAEKQQLDERRIGWSDQSSPLGDEATLDGAARRRKRPRWRKRGRRPKGRRNRTAIGRGRHRRRRLLSAPLRDRENDFAFTSVEGDAEQRAKRRGDKSSVYWHYTRCSNKKRKKPAAPERSAT